MRTTSCTPRSAATAIAAVLALTAAPSLSQEASAPPLDGPIVNVQPVVPSDPVVAAAPAPSPVIVLPEFPAEEPAAQAEPEQTAPAAAAAIRSQAPAREPAARAALEPVAAAPAETPVEPVTALDPLPEEPVAPLAAVPAAAEPVGFVGPDESRSLTAFLVAALVALLALIGALIAFAVRRRRRSSAALAREVRLARQPEQRPAAAVAEPVPMAEPVTEFDRPLARPLRSTGAAVPLPARVPESFAERDALIRRMVDAPPDRANPFTDRRARLKRARLILQSLGRTFGNAKPWIDFSDYPENWPEFARSPGARPELERTRQLEPA